MKKELYYKLEDNADMSCVCTSIAEATEMIEVYTGDWEPDKVEELFFTITPVYMIESEFEALGEAQF